MKAIGTYRNLSGTCRIRIAGILKSGRPCGTVLPLSGAARIRLETPARDPCGRDLRSRAAADGLRCEHGGLQAADARIAEQSRAAVLDLYSLDTQIAGAQARLGAIRAQEHSLRNERASLATELRFARRDARLSQQRIAMRVRFLYDHGTTSTLELFFGARSLSRRGGRARRFGRVMSVNDDVLQELQTARSD